MSWLMVSDKLNNDPKFASISLAASGLWLLCLSWVGDQLTDGFVPQGIAMRLGAGKSKPLAAELVAAGLWEVTEGGWMIHDYLDYNPSKADVLARREELAKVRSEAGKKGAEVRWGGAKRPASQSPEDGKQDGKPIANSWQSDGKTMAPDPDPFPIPKRQTDTDHGAKPTRGGRSSDFVEETLAQADSDPQRCHWRAELEKATPTTVRDRAAYQAKMLRNWLAGDGAPPLEDISEARAMLPRLKGPPPPLVVFASEPEEGAAP